MEEHVLTEWAARFKGGDQRSFRRMVDALTRTLIAMAFRYTGDWEWARDLTQDTWMRVHEQIGRYDTQRSFVSWLHTVHRNVCLDHLRRGWVQRESPTGAEELARLAGPGLQDPAAEVERREFHERVIAATRELTESQRRVFVRVDVEQAGQTEVARELGIRPGTLRTTLHFARRRMAAALNHLEGIG